jgi:exodeoxyribonuclease V alpha subunit
LDFLHDLFPKATPGLLNLFAGASENADLQQTDFYTIRDLLDLSGYENDEALCVLLLVMLLALNEGSLCVEASAEGFARRLADIAEEDVVQKWADQALAGLASGGFPSLFGRLLEENKPVVLLEIEDRSCLYFQKYLRHEQGLVECLQKRLQSGTSPLPGNLREVVQEVLVRQPLWNPSGPVTLNQEQQTAVALPLLRNFVMISGGPGTGKTSIVVAVLRCLVRCGFTPERLALAAPTGRAAQRLTDTLRSGLATLDGPHPPDQSLNGLTACTLHQLLRYHPRRGTFLHHAENPVPADVVMVDEVSMVGVLLMAQLFQALAPQTRVILLGDKDQLSSVEAGAVFASLAPPARHGSFSQSVCTALTQLLGGLDLVPDTDRTPFQDVLVILKQNYRSEQRIQEAAQAINAGDQDIVNRLQKPQGTLAELQPQGGCWLLAQPPDLFGWRRLLEEWAQRQFLEPTGSGESYRELAARAQSLGADPSPDQRETLERLFVLLNRSRILTLLREGAWGASGINRFLRQWLRPHLDPGSRNDCFTGAPLLVTRNDRVRQLFNGDVGITLKGGDEYRVLFQRQGGFASFPVDALPAHELAFALTVHKSQGSEYEQVLLVVPPEGGRRLLTREMIYTGVTRAKQLALLCGPEDAVRLAIRKQIVRESALLRFVGA